MSQFKLFFTLLVVALVVLCAQAEPVCDGTQDYAPDENDCSAYYRCINGTPVPFNCPPGLNWDTKQLSCNYKDLVVC
ncbi:hypothetical protein [Absidia glauca]|uniref:Chitin-binding type-2 domain-containing protein n=1 Tax=Absidia glauca TaxID=4829 RepID=A0A163JRP1_ABSGL|nr:hypothetical protein [Absidia glauca]